jgi:hypothetical protein
LDYINVDDDAYGRSEVLMYREEDDMPLTRIPFGATREMHYRRNSANEKPTASAQLQSKSDMSRLRMNMLG